MHSIPRRARAATAAFCAALAACQSAAGPPRSVAPSATAPADVPATRGATDGGAGGPVAVSVRVDRAGNLGRLDPGFAGFSFEKTNLTNGFLTGENAALVALFKLLGPGILRIGANDVDRSTWVPGAQPVAPGQTSLRTGTADVEALAAFLDATGWRVIYAVSMKGTPAASAAEAEYVAAKLGAKLYALEIGNEINFFPNTDAGTPTAQWEPFERAIRRAAPHVRLAAPAAGGAVAEFTVPFAERERGKVTLLTQHYYKGAAASHPTLADLLAADPSVVAQSDALASAVRTNRIADGYRWDEMNSYSGHGAAGVSDAFAAALWGVDFMLTTAEHGATGVNFHGGGQNMDGNECANGAASCTRPFLYSPIREVDSRVTAVGPLYYAMLLVARIGAGTLLPTVVQPPDVGLEGHCVRRGDGSLDVVLANEDAAREVDAVLDAGGPLASAETFALRAPSLGATSGITFGGAAVTPTGEWTPRPAVPLDVKGSAVRVAVPAASVVVVRLRAAS